MTLDAEVLIVGAGVSGIGAAIELLRGGQRSLIILEQADTLGGTWRDNVYPGVAVDIPVSSYCFSYEMEFPWSRLYAPGHEILSYLRHCSTKHGVDDYIRTGCRVAYAAFDPSADVWTVHLDDGRQLVGRYVIAATGLFAKPVVPSFQGLESFAGETMHTARWRDEVTLSGKRVGIVGTGASAVQVVPRLARVAGHLTVFQRTATWVSPRFDAPLSARSRPMWVHRLRRWVSEASIEALTFAAVNQARVPALVRAVELPIRWWMRRQNTDPAVADALTPLYALGCKRPTSSNEYLAAFNEGNVSLEVAPISKVVSSGVEAGGVVHPLDVLVFATGFETTHKGNQPTFGVWGLEGVELSDFWEANRLQSYAGIAVRGFPNFFLTAGPYSGGFNWFAMLETHLQHIMACLSHAWAEGRSRVEVSKDAYEAYVRETWALSEQTAFRSGHCAGSRSYYVDRHGDASLPSPRTPGQRARESRRRLHLDFDFSGG